MRNKAISISSDSNSDDDDVPLKVAKVNGLKEDPNSYDSLCRHSIEACEFCDRISKNRYSSLIHNVSHIIIPLLNQNVIQCPICLYYFTSEEDLASHNLKKHPELKNIANVSLVKIENIASRSTLELSRNVKSELPQLNESHSRIADDSPNVTIIGSIKNRLVFEDEDDLIPLNCNQLLNDLTTDCKVNIEMFDTPWLNGDEYSRSVHYDELVKPGVYRCRKCDKRFPIRYDAIIHESSHIRFKNCQVSLCVKCNKYLVGGRKDLRFHHYMFHRDIDKNHSETDILAAKKFNDENNMEDRRMFASKILSLCELCLRFCKNKSSMIYECIKSVCEVGKRFPCEKCGQLFFEIKIVRRVVSRRVGYNTIHNKMKKKTNEERLKTIAHRFKMMKH